MTTDDINCPRCFAGQPSPAIPEGDMEILPAYKMTILPDLASIPPKPTLAIPDATSADLARDAVADMKDHWTSNGVAVYEPREWLWAWIRRAVTAERECERLTEKLNRERDRAESYKVRFNGSQRIMRDTVADLTAQRQRAEGACGLLAKISDRIKEDPFRRSLYEEIKKLLGEK